MTLISIFTLLLLSCGPKIVSVPPDILAAPEYITLNGIDVTLQAYLWRDFMPGTNDSSLRVTIRLHSVKEPPLVRFETVWIIQGDAAWTFSSSKATNEIIGRDGPKWPEGASIDVVVKLRDESGKTFLLKQRQQRIKRTS